MKYDKIIYYSDYKEIRKNKVLCLKNSEERWI